MSEYTSTLRGRDELAEGTLAFRFAKPAGFAFKSGQAIDVVLPGSGDAAPESVRHTFSLVSAPHENELTVATRMRDSAYKRALGSLPIGSPVKFEGPFGSLILHNNRARAAVFVAGGIGITPFISMLRQAAHDHLERHIVLLYSNRRPEDTAFLDELQQLARRHDNFRLVATMTEVDRSSRPWDGDTGLIDEALVRRELQGLAQPICYVAGPPAMIEAMRQVLHRSGIDDDDIRSEEFYGY